MRAILQVSLLALAFFAMPAGPAFTQSAQSAAERDYAEHVKFVDHIEQLLKSTEEARLRGDCWRLEYNASSFNYHFHWGPIEHNILPEQLADWKRRRDELYDRPCPPTEAVAPKSTGPERTPEPEPSSAAETDDSGDIFDNPDNAKAGVGLTPRDEPGISAPTAGGPQPGPKPPEPEPSPVPDTDDSSDIFDNPDNAKAGVGLTPMDEPAKSPSGGEPLGADPPRGPTDASPNSPPGPLQDKPPAQSQPAKVDSTGSSEPAPKTSPPARRPKREESPDPPRRPGDPSPNPTPDGN